MLLEVNPPGPVRPLLGPRTKLSAVLSVLLALGVVALLSLNARYASPALVLSAQFAAVVSLVLGVSSFAWGMRSVVRSKPEYRRPLAFLAAVTLAVLALHIYIIGSPATYTGSSVSGAVGTTFSDSHLQVASTLTGSQLKVTVADTGSNAVSQVAVSLDNTTLQGSDLSPVPTPLSPLQPSNASSAGFPTSTVGSWSVQATPSSTLRVDYQYLTCYHVPDAGDRRGVFGCVMDESYYVPAALSLASGTQCAPYADSCNLEHPPLAKALIAAGIAVFGLNDFGWRISNVVLGSLSIPLLYVLVYTLTGARRISYLATLIFAADTLFFVHSSAALIDVPSVFFSLLGLVFYFHRSSWGRLNNHVASGIFFGLAALSKETAVFALAAVVTYDLLFGAGGFRESVGRVAPTVGPAVLVFVGAIQLYDLTLAYSAVPWFYQHIGFMFSYGAGLKGGGWTDARLGRFITPIDWILAYTPVSYLVTNVTITTGGAATSALEYVSVGYYGTSNQVVVWMLFLWVPFGVYRYFKARRSQEARSPDDNIALFLVVWFLWSYLPYITLWLYGRVTYPFYLLPAIPALSAGAAYFSTRGWFPRKMVWVYVIAAFAIFLLYFPVKDFLPVAVRAWLSR